MADSIPVVGPEGLRIIASALDFVTSEVKFKRNREVIDEIVKQLTEYADKGYGIYEREDVK